jgi:hypothetical protein
MITVLSRRPSPKIGALNKTFLLIHSVVTTVYFPVGQAQRIEALNNTFFLIHSVVTTMYFPVGQAQRIGALNKTFFLIHSVISLPVSWAQQSHEDMAQHVMLAYLAFIRC